MCGIFGMVSPRIDRKILETSTSTLSHRGPNDAGYFTDDNVGLGHRRLSIIDLEGGHQPIFNEDGSKCIIFNGEVYNFEELAQQLLLKGHKFSTRSDTESILHAYEEWGESCVERLRGIFAFAIWDRTKKTLFIARDWFGIKPLFYGEHNGTFYFASEMKAILANPDFPREIDEFALASYFTLSYIPAPQTIFKHIRKLPPAHTLLVQNGKVYEKEYWNLKFAPDRSRNERYFINGFMDILEESVKMQLVSEVPLGAFLSGGIDSSTVVALMSKVSESQANTVCMGFGGDVGGYLDERKFARQVSERYSTAHREYEVMPDAGGLAETIVRAFDEPFADDSAIPSFYVCKIAKEAVTVALSGLGGDELFGGYERYLGFKLSTEYRRLPRFFRGGPLRGIFEGLQERADGHYTVNHLKRFMRSASLPPDLCYFGFISKMSPEVKRTLFSEQNKFDGYQNACRDQVLSEFNSPNVLDGPGSLNRAFYCDIKTYLPEDILAVTDRMSMHHALEVRVPFLDHKLVEFCATIPPELKIKWSRKKYLLKKAVKNLLPKDVITHRKQGFVGPMAQWLKKDLKPYVLETMSDKNLKKHDMLNSKTIRTILEQHFSGKEIHDTLIWSVLMFQVWFDIYIDNRK